MRTIVQRVTAASVTVEGKVVGAIEHGLMCLIGISSDDKPEDIDYLVKKILGLRVFEVDANKPWTHNVVQMKYKLLLGHKPDFHTAMPPALARPFFAQFVAAMKKAYAPDMIAEGEFGAMMSVQLTNDGPVTITLESDSKELPVKKKDRSVPTNATAAPPAAGVATAEARLLGMVDQSPSQSNASSKPKREKKANHAPAAAAAATSTKPKREKKTTAATATTATAPTPATSAPAAAPSATAIVTAAPPPPSP